MTLERSVIVNDSNKPHQVLKVLQALGRYLGQQVKDVPADYLIVVRMPNALITQEFKAHEKYAAPMQWQVVPITVVKEFITKHPSAEMREYLTLIDQYVRENKIPCFIDLCGPQGEYYLLVPYERQTPTPAGSA